MTDERARRIANQEVVARHLIEAVHKKFTGSDVDRLVGSEPNEHVVIGVLNPRDDRPYAPSHPDLPEEPGVPIDVLPASELGVTVWVDLPTSATTADFDIEVTFSVFLHDYPTWHEQQAWMTGRSSRDDSAQIRSDDDDRQIGDDAIPNLHHDTPSDGDTPASSPGSIHNTDGNPSSDAVQATNNRATSRRSERLALVYARRDVAASISLNVPLAGGTITDEGELQDVLLDTITANPGRLAFLLRGRAKSSVSSSSIDAGPEAYEAEISDRRTANLPPLPAIKFLASSTPDPRGGWRINLTFANDTIAPIRRNRPAQTIYNANFSARLSAGTYQNFGYRIADDDWRIHPEVYAHGRFCIGEVEGDIVRTNTWPVYRDSAYESAEELQPEFKDLIDSPISTLISIADHMARYADQWSEYANTMTIELDKSSACQLDLDGFRDEIRRFYRGIELLEQDDDLRAAFVYANQAFLLMNTPNGLNPNATVARGEPKITSWRIFQIIFIVCGLSALAAREDNYEHLVDELSIADVLWFPTGGGKSEAFLGLVAIALFYDRQRGKMLGTTALLRFPLRMLSVQQLDRILRLVASCEHIRQTNETSIGEAFELGYFVGRNNTPNTLTKATDDKWGDIHRMAKWSADERRNNVVITICPYCSSTAIELIADPSRIRLDHICRDCTLRIPVVVSDDEIYRTLPSVVVATVDKLAIVAFQPHFSHLTHGPAFRCPDHGYVTFATGRSDRRRCLARSACSIEPTEWQPIHCYDPAPAIVIQDELHLLSEELGTLNAHYETLLAHLCRAGARIPPKVIAATATISDYENQVKQLYALEPRRFPSDGFREGESFYAARRDFTRRLFVGALPSRLDTAQFCISAARIWRAELDRLRSLPTNQCLQEIGLVDDYDDEKLAALLFRYELQLIYANRKNDAERSHEQLRRAGNRGPSRFEAEILTGDTPLPDISAAIRRVESESLTNTPDPGERLAAIAGTSLVSHGIDLARLNALFVAGMPPTNAYYVQATARAGRTDVGVVFTAFSRSAARDRAAFHFFHPQHAYASKLVEPVSLNRFAIHSPKKTATGLLSGLIMNRLARDPNLNPVLDNNQRINMMYAHDFRQWLSQQPQEIDDELIEEVLLAYGLESLVLDKVVAGYFGDAVRSRLIDELSQLRAAIQTTIQRSFLNKPPRSFRDIDESVEFGAYGYYSGKDFRTLTGRKHNDVSEESESPMATETEEID